MTNGGSPGGEDPMMKLVFHGVKDSLIKIKGATKANMPDAQPRANILREHLRIVGNFIRKILNDDESSTAGMEGRLW